MLEIRHLKTLVALRETGSLVEAAERVHLTQSALSHQLKDLEGRLGGELFVRKSRPVRFTPAGKRVLALADDVLEKLEHAERDLNKLLHGEAGRLNMAIECHSCFNWLMPTIESYRDHWPAVELDFAGGFTFEPLPALVQGDIDLVVTADPQLIRGVEYVPLFSYEMQFALARTHPLAKREWLSPEDLRDQTLITYPVERGRLDVFKQFLEPAGVEPGAVRTAELTLMMVQLVANERGVAALPNWVLAEYASQSLITVRPAGAQGIWPILYAAIRESQVDAPYMQDFLKLAREHCLKHLSGVRRVSGQGSQDVVKE
ncbi:LysR family transcriptional regulator [Marinimicrobium sp. ARAG 43.8]|uniref:LysR family transcriptional regulator n=1 Tax=Marinimicrobium sp. ARAG 43.8 TaxID=3418719 RepID=UPI003CF1388D